MKIKTHRSCDGFCRPGKRSRHRVIRGVGLVSLTPSGKLHRGLENHAVGFLGILGKLVEVQITVGIHSGFIYLRH